MVARLIFTYLRAVALVCYASHCSVVMCVSSCVTLRFVDVCGLMIRCALVCA